MDTATSPTPGSPLVASHHVLRRSTNPAPPLHAHASPRACRQTPWTPPIERLFLEYLTGGHDLTLAPASERLPATSSSPKCAPERGHAPPPPISPNNRPPARVQNALQSADTLRHRPSRPITGHQSLLLALRTSSPLRATPCWIKRCRAPRTLSLRHSTPPSPTTHPRNGGAASHSLCTRWSSHSFSAPTGTS
jgi:hypothetical protein